MVFKGLLRVTNNGGAVVLSKSILGLRHLVHERVVYRFGKLIKLDEQTLSQKRLDFARVQVFINNWKSIDEIADIRVLNEIFVVKVVEEKFGEMDLGKEWDEGSKTSRERHASVGSTGRNGGSGEEAKKSKTKETFEGDQTKGTFEDLILVEESLIAQEVVGADSGAVAVAEEGSAFAEGLLRNTDKVGSEGEVSGGVML
ncbi:hypothetical protein A2U01_0028580, partial [Trifolium medium]|nr:hypothetical protein [Trifolium medium]